MSWSSRAGRCVTWGRSERDLGLEHGNRLPDDPDPGDASLFEIQLHLDPSWTVNILPLHAPEGGAAQIMVQKAVVSEVYAEQAVRVAAHRILADAEGRAEHARFGEVVVVAGREGEDEVAGSTDLCRQGRQAGHVGLQMLQRLRSTHADQQPCAARAGDA